MSDPRLPATPPPVPTDATGEWSSVTSRDDPAPAEHATLTVGGQSLPPESGLGIPNPFGRYTVIRLLGRGGMGSVFLAHDTQLDRSVALKIPTFRGTLSASQKERFLREARAVAGLHHRNICFVYDVDEEQGTLYLTTAFIDGQTLGAAVKDGPLDPTEAAELIRKVALGMEAAHVHGVIHRDLKPANIMLDRDREPIVMDFGLARKGLTEDGTDAEAKLTTASDVGLTQMGSVLGTPAYMPPEQATGNLDRIGPRSDVYALGAVLYECLTGRRPFDGPDTSSVIQKILHVPPPRPRDLVPTLDPALERICLTAMAKAPADRYPSMSAFAAALKGVLDPELKVVLPPPLPPASGKRKAVKKKRRWVTPVSCLAVSVAILVVCVGGPTAAVYWLIGFGADKIKEISEGHERSNAEWDAIMAFWQPPAEDAKLDELFPPTLPGGYRRTRNDRAVADAELGITLPGQRAFYTGKDGAEYEVRVYRCPDAEAKAIQDGVYAFATSVQKKTAPERPGSVRKNALYTGQDSAHRTVTYGFADESNQSQEYGKLWRGTGWLYLFKTTTPLAIELFPSIYLMEVMKRAKVPATESKTKAK